MKEFIKILALIKSYKARAILIVSSNIFSIIFSIFSIAMVIPFLQILFGTVELTVNKPIYGGSPAFILDYFQYFLSRIIIENGKDNALLFICVSVGVLFLCKNSFRYLSMYMIAVIRNGVLKEYRNKLYKKILILPLSYFSRQKRGDVISRATQDIHDVEWSIMRSFDILFRDPFQIIGVLVVLLIINIKLTLIVLFILPVSGYVISLVGKSIKSRSVIGQKKMGGLLSLIEESLSNLRIIKAFNAIDLLDNKFRQKNASYTRHMTNIYRRREIASPLTEVMGILIMIIIMWIGGNIVLKDSNQLDAEVFIAYIAFFSQLIAPAKSFTTAFYNIKKGLASAERINEVLSADEKIIERSDAKAITNFNETIEYNNVSFQYDKENIISNVSLTITKGKVLAIAGPSGGGKTTLADLLPRFYDCSSGDIIIDGHHIKDLKIDSLRSLFGIVSQHSILFHDTVYNNISFGSDSANMEAVVAAAKTANAHEFICQLPDGYDTIIGDKGSKLSGGQKQRLSIARAVLKNPPILILDEATSALDAESEIIVQEALSKLMKNRTTVVISHHLKTIHDADEIIVISAGEIVEKGKHEELLANKQMYANLYENMVKN